MKTIRKMLRTLKAWLTGKSPCDKDWVNLRESEICQCAICCRARYLRGKNAVEADALTRRKPQ